jgi:hypothetical protein
MHFFTLLFDRKTLAGKFDENAHLGYEASAEDETMAALLSDADYIDSGDEEIALRCFEEVYCVYLEVYDLFWPMGSSDLCECCGEFFPSHDGSFTPFWPPRHLKSTTAGGVEVLIPIYGACNDCALIEGLIPADSSENSDDGSYC